MYSFALFIVLKTMRPYAAPVCWSVLSRDYMYTKVTGSLVYQSEAF